MVTRVTNKTTKYYWQKEKLTRYIEIKLSLLPGKRNQKRMSLQWAREAIWKMGVLVVYSPGIRACAGSVGQATTGELSELPAYRFGYCQVGSFQQSR